ncbi:glucodextranase DOMON-like domain-containing protein [Thermoleophilum album]|uniref:C-terminal binding-module, SLH-like, of glucodextranase n=1 Tax=Thermoleophilum album TaxID=29539 RepID=A0A1H6FJT5_THEAL|nr:glucodextranase DOMON-like domain-containing protein [Thermoleophilum album]SEH10428.1 C-terminal binding-module, SLH-like, of glucodextranase [Thermoleophilum album]
MNGRRRTFSAFLRLVPLVGAVAGLLGAAVAEAAPSGLPRTAGPDLLRWPPAVAPQLTNTGIWRAPPILVSGSSAYRDGEYLYQDYLFDDNGAKGQFRDYSEPQPTQTAPPQGTYTYPSAPQYRRNVADLVEVRVKPLAEAVAFRVTLNTMTDPALVGVTLALGRPGSATRPYPLGANASGPADVFVTVNGSTAYLTDAAGRTTRTSAISSSVDSARSQLEVRVPRSVWDPGAGRGLVAVGVGLWDRRAQRYLVPQAVRDAEHPDGAAGLAQPTAFFNVAFRREPATCCSSTAWRDQLQAAELAKGNMTPFTREIDFGKLERRVNDESDVQRYGSLNRIFASHFTTGAGQGVDLSVNCDNIPRDCPGQYQGQLQPYNLYVPKASSGPYGLVLLLHAHSANHNQFSESRTQAQLAQRSGTTSVVLTPLARGPDGAYRDAALADVFEAWADVARHYQLDPSLTVVAGYSMGAGGTYQLAQQFPDLFAGAFVEVGANLQPGRAASLRWVPVIQWNAVVDEFVRPDYYLTDARTMFGLGYRYELDLFPIAEHLTLAINDSVTPAADYLGARRVVSDPPPSGVQAGAGVLTGGAIPALPYTRQFQTWGEAPRFVPRDRLDLKLRNIASLAIDLARARLSCKARVRVDSDGPAVIAFVGRRCGSGESRTVSVPAGPSVVTPMSGSAGSVKRRAKPRSRGNHRSRRSSSNRSRRSRSVRRDHGSIRSSA